MNLSFSTEEQNIFFTADTHFGHQKILRFNRNRPFKNLSEMNNVLFTNWNKYVSPEDIIFHLGDVLGKEEEEFQLISQLNGKKYLVPGNNDNPKRLRKLAEFFTILPSQATISIDGQRIHLCHHPRPFQGLLLHGHTHLLTKPQKGDMQIDVGVDAWKYAPVNWEKLWKCI